MNIRLAVGALISWDRERDEAATETFAGRLTAADRSKSLVLAGTCEGPFRIVYRFDNEQLVEVISRTAHAAALGALVETATGYRFYFAVYVRSVGARTEASLASGREPGAPSPGPPLNPRTATGGPFAFRA